MTDSQGGILSTLSTAYNLLKLVPVRKDFSTVDKAFLSEYGGFPINRMRVCRTPLDTFVGSALNIITIGRWEKAKAMYGYDKIFHLFLLVEVLDTRSNKVITAILEKNETPRCRLYSEPLSNQTECQWVDKKYAGSLNTLISTTQAQMGTSFWVYDAFKNNCQDFLLNVLGSNGLLTSDLQAFIKQPVDDIARELPSYTAGFARAVTDTARRVRTIFGRGLDVEKEKLT